MLLDDTYTDVEFQRKFVEANRDWIGQIKAPEPDLCVDGLSSTLLGRLLHLLAPKER